MSESADALRAAAALLLTKAAELDGKGPAAAGFNMNDYRTWWPAMQEQFRRDSLPHAWREAGPGVPISMVGDNDDSVEMDDLLRAFGPFMTLAENSNFNKPEPVVRDSTGAPFHRITIKRRAGLGRQAIRTLRDEIRGVWYSPWGQATRTDPLNANLMPKPEVVFALFDKVYD